MNHFLSSIMFLSFITLHGCVAQRPIDLHVHSHEYKMENLQVSMEMDLPVPEVRASLENPVAADLPAPPIHWTCGLVTNGKLATKMTEFTIVGMAEQYVPITGEIKGLIFHVQMSPKSR